MPDNYTYKTSNINPNQLFIDIENSNWEYFLRDFEQKNQIKMVLKTYKKENSKTFLNRTLMCHHGFKSGQKKYEVEETDVMGSSRKKKIDCPFSIKLAIEKSSLNKLIVEILMNEHNHEINSHSLSFIRINDEVLAKINSLFESQHSPAAVKEQIEKDANIQELSDRSRYPRTLDYYRLYYKWIEERFGAENGGEMFEKLREKINLYKGGSVFYNGN